MRWIPYILLVYAAALLQTTVGALVTFRTAALGNVGPDLVALLVVFVALHARGLEDAVLAAWAGGMAMDLIVAGGADTVTVLGPMSLAYAASAAMVFTIREAFFRERPLPQLVLAILFCLPAHAMWVTAQSLLAGRDTVTWSLYGRRLLQAAALTVYTGVLMPPAHRALWRIREWITPVAAGRTRRAR